MSYKITKSNVIKFTDSEKGVLTFQKKGKKPMKISDLEVVSKQFEKKYKDKKDSIKYYIRAFGNLAHPITFKSFDNDIDYDVMDDYLEGKVRNKAKFDVLYSIEIGYIKTTKN